MFQDYPDVVTVEDLTKMLHIGKNTAYKLINDNSIGSIHIGRKVLIPKINVIEFLLINRNASTPKSCYNDSMVLDCGLFDRKGVC